MEGLKTPVLLVIFNRPETTQAVFEEMRKIKPQSLFIAADGPRENNENDEIQCKKTREIIKQIDWDCSLKTLFREDNIGCKRAVKDAIDWFFEDVKEGIILEDDCVPDSSFFRFCEKMLKMYNDDKRIMMISGMNYLVESEIEGNHFFSKYFPIWGWATWKRAWEFYDGSMLEWGNEKGKECLDYYYHDKGMSQFVSSMLDLVYNNKVSTWDLQWIYSCIFNNALCVIPSVNLITNIGFEGTHTNGKESRSVGLRRISINLKQENNPILVRQSVEQDKLIFDRILDRDLSIFQKILKRLGLL